MSRADLWQFAGTVALEIEIERANFGCDYDYNQGNQVRMKVSEVKCEKYLDCPKILLVAKWGSFFTSPSE